MHILTPYKSNCSNGQISKLNLFYFTMVKLSLLVKLSLHFKWRTNYEDDVFK
jgi:hypothetical protein